MSKRLFLYLALVLSLLQCTVAQDNVSGATIVKKQLANGLDRGKWNFRKWAGHYLADFNLGTDSEQSFAVYDSDDRLVTSAVVSFADSKSISLRDVAIDGQGFSYVTGGTLSNAGAIANFIEKFDRSGKRVATLRTNPFVPQHLCVTGDGSLWALGWDRDGESTHADYPILRRFDFASGEISSMLNRKQVSGDYLRGVQNAYLVCSRDRVGVYFSGDALWFEASANGQGLSAIALPPAPPNARTIGAAFTSTNQLFITVNDRTHAATGMFQLVKLGQDRGTWAAVDGPWTKKSESMPIVELLGSDDTNLVLIRSRTDPTAYWVPAPPPSSPWCK